jgi:hypothetical protein
MRKGRHPRAYRDVNLESTGRFARSNWSIGLPTLSKGGILLWLRILHCLAGSLEIEP